MRIKKFISFFLVGTLLLFQSIPTFAQTPSDTSADESVSNVQISPRWVNTNDIMLDLSFGSNLEPVFNNV